MPEGPEVYTIANKLNARISGMVLQELKFHSNSRFYNKDLGIPTRSLLKRVYYRGKKIVFEFEDYCIVSFLGMTGSWNYDASEKTSAEMVFEDFVLYYEDVRRFGLIDICAHQDLEKVFKNIGRDYIIDKISLSEFSKEIKNKRRAKSLLCKFLLQPKPFAGIGNYLRTDIMYLSKLRPDRTLSSLNDDEIEVLYHSINTIMQESIKCGGLTMSDYWDPERKIGTYKPLVYGKKEDSFGNKVVKSRFDDRTTHWVVEVQQ